MSAFFISTLFSLVNASDCAPTTSTETATVKWVYDGDTVKLTDGRKVRLIGIDTPEMPRKNQKGERFAGQATEALREKLAAYNNQVRLQIGNQAFDKYKRQLAHLFTPDQQNLSKWLLEQGLATRLLLYPNFTFADCYQEAEKKAQLANINIWSEADFQLKTPKQLGELFTGYVRLKGTVQHITHRKKQVRLTLDQNIYITIKDPELRLFKNLDKLTGKAIMVSGQLYRQKGKAYLRLLHPSYLEY